MCNIRKNMAINFKKHIIPFAFILFLTACSSTKYVPDGEYLLDEIKILTDNKEVRASELSSYVRQKPNNKWFNIRAISLWAAVYASASVDTLPRKVGGSAEYMTFLLLT